MTAIASHSVTKNAQHGIADTGASLPIPFTGGAGNAILTAASPSGAEQGTGAHPATHRHTTSCCPSTTWERGWRTW
jgi:hypothetical protein